jgi:small-conductance mechanosensitive channel
MRSVQQRKRLETVIPGRAQSELDLPISRSASPTALALLGSVGIYLMFLSGTIAAQTGAGLQPLDPQRILSFVNESIDWYRHQNVERDIATDSGDVLFASDDQRLAEQILKLSFDSALAEADLQTKSGAAATAQAAQPGSAPDNARYAPMLKMAAQADQQVKQSHAEVDQFRAKLETATGRNRRTIESALAESQGELRLLEARRDMIKKMVEFVGGVNGGGGNLRSQIEELERSVLPQTAATSGADASTQAQVSKTAAPAAATLANRREPSGIIGLISDLFESLGKAHTIDETIRLTNDFAEHAKALRNPIFSQLRDLAKRSEDLAAKPDSTDPAVLAQQAKDWDAMTAQFQQASAIVLPLSKQTILLDQYSRSLAGWKAQVRSEYISIMKSLSLRLGVLAIVLAAVFVLAHLWRKAIYRYVRDARRRHQFLLLRRIVIWFVVLTVMAFGFATEIGSLATFAGLLTAGVAVALQNLILSVAGYFFLIGKYGLRVGDRVQISGVMGEVVEIGLVRVHLMELGGAGADAQPTGRVVAFSNSVALQGTGLFRQIPGTNFVWHQITLTLAPESNFRDVEERLMGAVDSVFEKYRDRMEAQRKQMQASLSLVSEDLNSFHPQSRLRVTQTGLEVVIRYPVDLEEASEIDDRITRALLEAIERPPQVRLVGTGTPNLQPVSAPA